MCLAIPGQVVELLPDRLAVVDLGGITRRASLDLLEGVQVGDWVAIHAGFAIAKLDEAEARETLSLLRQIALVEEAPAGPMEPEDTGEESHAAGKPVRSGASLLAPAGSGANGQPARTDDGPATPAGSGR